MDDKVLRAALLKLKDNTELPSSQFTVSQRNALDQFSRQTGAVRCQQQGRGAIYRIADPDLFATHFAALSPAGTAQLPDGLPMRARHIASARNSKAGAHQHEQYYLLIKSVGENVSWFEAERQISLPLSQATSDFGAATLLITPVDGWHAEGELWLVENQALFDRTDWLSTSTKITLAYYGGQLNNILLNWLASRQRAGKVVLFPDYDGVGLANFVRLQAKLGEQCDFWLMPYWSQRLAQYGNHQLWRDTLRDFEGAYSALPEKLASLAKQMQQTGMALEQEAVWLSADSVF